MKNRNGIFHEPMLAGVSSVPRGRVIILLQIPGNQIAGLLSRRPFRTVRRFLMARVTLFFGTVHQRQAGMPSPEWCPNPKSKHAARGIGGDRMFLFLK